MAHFLFNMEEIWKDVVGYEGLYQVSNFGNVKSVDRVIMRSSTPQPIKGRIVHQGIQNTGYKIVTLWNKKERKVFLVHRLVADAFIPKTDLFRNNVDHINGIRVDNRVENLRWCTQKENTNFPIARSKYLKANQKRINNIRKFHANHSLKLAQLKIDGTIIKIWDNVKEASSNLKISANNIYNSCIGKRNTCGGYMWKYVKDLNL